MQVINTTTERSHLASFRLVFVSHFRHLVTIFLLTSFLPTSGCQQAKVYKFWLSRNTVQVWRGVKGHYDYPVSAKHITEPSSHPSATLRQPSPSVCWHNRSCGDKVTCTTPMFLGSGHYFWGAEKPAISLVTANRHCERGCNAACMPSLAIYYGSMKM